MESFRPDDYLKVHLLTKSVIERQRAEIDGKLAIFEIEDVIAEIDFWILLTPFDDDTDFRNLLETNLEFITQPEPIFTQQ
mmetsp:Transcript_15469/g.20940  ORF Transcript_15469/g.20940 Transcript_15469/m.20940 type:complete len:80 (-) Transcript_15469:1007-1246(-)|eukprot:CAMPEP_0185568190 /NCGR_PEP_ID=MMETSP0434-20130131/1223_1 /TAXON_ID=626734 ORGANISM="Favella taraikaensis, Strain Fe Narragansett Bay" /NCGR_SAMPLE_ID=MMETSP0434 /ASSEMBLY_ACC=CAM_ASM_000379 /LENGTH=79 /DNA_ID=CAMNT_0028182619 /DNA_START=391 /DNA_END=630 /DNA_ORIENTATION=-